MQCGAFLYVYGFLLQLLTRMERSISRRTPSAAINAWTDKNTTQILQKVNDLNLNPLSQRETFALGTNFKIIFYSYVIRFELEGIIQ